MIVRPDGGQVQMANIKNPCKQCIVTSMCEKVCTNLISFVQNYIPQLVYRSLKEGEDVAIGSTMRTSANQSSEITYYTTDCSNLKVNFTFENGDIKYVKRFRQDGSDESML